MTKIRILPDDQELEPRQGETLLDASLRAGIAHVHSCGGKARCSTCRVVVVESAAEQPERNAAEQAMAARAGLCSTVRLACQLTPTSDLTVRRLVLDETDREMILPTLDAKGLHYVGEEKEVAILFSDIRGFTTFSETLPAYDVIHVLQRHFHQMTQVVHRHGGIVNNFMGDGMMALFGVDGAGDAPYRSVAAALGMLEAMDSFKPYLRTAYRQELELGIGIHYGPAVIGSIGTGAEARLTAIGDSVNLASRVESANKLQGTRLLVTPDVFTQVRGRVATGKTVSASLKGKSGEFELVEIAGLGGQR